MLLIRDEEFPWDDNRRVSAYIRAELHISAAKTDKIITFYPPYLRLPSTHLPSPFGSFQSAQWFLGSSLISFFLTTYIQK